MFNCFVSCLRQCSFLVLDKYGYIGCLVWACVGDSDG